MDHDKQSLNDEGDVLRHRLYRSYEAEAENISSDTIIDRIFDKLQVP